MDDKALGYHEKKKMDYTVKLRELLKELPPYAKDYFRAKEAKSSIRTRVSYAYDMKVFFNFLQVTNPCMAGKEIRDITLNDLDYLMSSDIEEYQEYLKLYDTDSGIGKNSESGIARKMSSLRSFLEYFYKKEMISGNPALLVDMPKIHEKAIIHLDPDEVAILLDSIESYDNVVTGHKKAYFEKTKSRDIALITLLLGTGIRVSECVGLDINDINFKDNSFRVTRKGGNEEILYFGDEVQKALCNYIDGPRAKIHALPGHENALFFTIQRRRMGVDAVEDVVKKYAQEFIPQKKITPHKLRSTYGTSLYQETGDIYLVADVLGHKDVNTTRKHYADINSNQRRQAATAIRLRET